MVISDTWDSQKNLVNLVKSSTNGKKKSQKNTTTNIRPRESLVNIW